MKAEMPVTTQLPAKVLLKLAILGGFLLGGVFGVIQLFATAIKMIQ